MSDKGVRASWPGAYALPSGFQGLDYFGVGIVVKLYDRVVLFHAVAEEKHSDVEVDGPQFREQVIVNVRIVADGIDFICDIILQSADFF